jgi:hypothetical protein
MTTRILIVLGSFCLLSFDNAASQPLRVALVDSAALVKLVGTPYSPGTNIPFGGTSWNGWGIRDSAGCYFSVDNYEIDSLHLLILSCYYRNDKPVCRAAPNTILDIMAISIDRSRMLLVDSWCQRNGKKDESIFAVVAITETPYFKRILRAWRINPRTTRFQEIPVRGIICENMGYGD